MLNKIKYTSKNYNGLQVACDWIQDLEESNSRLHKEGVIEKALVAARLGSHSAECFLYNCYLAYNPYFMYNIKQVYQQRRTVPNSMERVQPTLNGPVK